MTLFDILICTIEGREASLAALHGELYRQIVEAGAQNLVGIRVLKDKAGEHTTGEKRQQLVESCEAEYYAFVDDDDRVSTTYIVDILHALEVRPDTVGFWGLVTFVDSSITRAMIHSLCCLDWDYSERYNLYFRPPNHLNPVRTALGKLVPFSFVTISEDHFWSVAMKQAGLLKSEVFLGEKPLYFYHCRGNVGGL